MPSREFEELLVQLRSSPIDAGKSLVELRQGFDAMGLAFTPPEGATFVQVDADGVKAEWTRVPESNDTMVLFYLHGGGYIMGSPVGYRNFVARICRAGGVRALSVDYRLAPEAPFPAALEDAVKAYQWLLQQQVHPSRIVIAGDSAGGGLALSTLLALKEKGIPLPGAAICLSPSTDLARTGPSIVTKAAEDVFLTRELLDVCFDSYLGPRGDPHNPLASPLYSDLTGLPPLLIMVGTAEVLLDDSTRLAEKAKEAGVEVELQVAEGMIHVWSFFASVIPEGQQGVEAMGAFIRKRLQFTL
ncbi:alpha/beta hydrolase [Variovorax sp. ZT4R33]|uniref:alpha/beta hydrolase n=1 Tax=Variovorax sp. ZT4R33 TaxID=3443743 RepID=UPI003F471E4E